MHEDLKAQDANRIVVNSCLHIGLVDINMTFTIPQPLSLVFLKLASCPPPRGCPPFVLDEFVWVERNWVDFFWGGVGGGTTPTEEPSVG